MSAAKSKAQGIIESRPIAMFSKSYCPYCNASKALLVQLGVSEDDLKAVELDVDDDGDDIQAALAEISGQSTVPNIFIGKKHIGGNSDIQRLNKQGALKRLLQDAHAI